jgi:tetratricopeptide (TPR) repeat protein
MTDGADGERLERLLGFLEQDPANAALLRDAARTALDANQLERAKDLFGRLRDLGELTDADSNSWAIAAMRSGEPEKAAETFASLLEQQPDNPALKFNLAWSRALAGNPAAARAVLDDETVETLPQAAQLEVQLMHEAGEFDAAAERARGHLERFPDYGPLLAAVSVLALDVEDEALARACAEKAGGHPDALTTLGTLTLGDSRPLEARAMFERSLAISQGSPRAWVGLGLTDMLQGKNREAGEHIDRGAEMFGTHLGSWIAAGWAYLLAGDRETARQRFERAVEIDGNFAEAQGSLAVIELLGGETAAAERRVEVALRLDRNCFSAAFANVLMNAAKGDEATAQRIMDMVLRQPIGADGRTIADAIARMAR